MTCTESNQSLCEQFIHHQRHHFIQSRTHVTDVYQAIQIIASLHRLQRPVLFSQGIAQQMCTKQYE